MALISLRMHCARLCGWILIGLCSLLGQARAADAEASSAPAGLSGLADSKARQTFKEGIEAFDRRDFEAARVAFLQTFALKPSVPVVRRNLGLAEIYSGHYLDGARRLARVLHTTGEGTAEDRARMLDSLKKAEAHLERVTIEVNVDGADILVDAVDLGTSPLPFVWYVAPGAYRVQVSKQGFAEFSQTRVARAGGVQHLRVSLAPASETAAAPRGASPPPAAVDTARAIGPNPWIVAVGAVATASGLGAGLGFTLAASSNSRKVDRIGYELAADGLDCVDASRECAALSRAASEHDKQVRWAAASFIAAGVAGLGTVVYAVVSRPSGGAASSSSGSPLGLELAVGEDAASLQWRTSF